MQPVLLALDVSPCAHSELEKQLDLLVSSHYPLIPPVQAMIAYIINTPRDSMLFLFPETQCNASVWEE